MVMSEHKEKGMVEKENEATNSNIPKPTIDETIPKKTYRFQTQDMSFDVEASNLFDAVVAFYKKAQLPFAHHPEFEKLSITIN